MRDLMIDLETLGTGARCGVIQAAFLQFDIETGETGSLLNVFVDKDSNQQSGRVSELGTMKFWAKQGGLFERIISKPDRIEINALPGLIRAWYSETFPKGSSAKRIWSNGADFDLPILADIFKQFEGPESSLPWLPWNHRCVRTFKALDPQSKGYLIQYQFENPGDKHDASYDVKAQAYQVSQIFKNLQLKTI